MRALGLLVAALGLAASAAAQQAISGSASSPTYFVAASNFGSGEEADTAFYKLQPSQGAGVVVEPDAASSTYRMRGGFPAALTSPTLGTMLLTGARPFYLKPVDNPTLTLHGTQLWLGNTPTVNVGGATGPAGVILRSVDQIVVNLPPLTVPGLQNVTVTNSTGASVLVEGVGVLPMMEKREPLNGADPNELRIRTLPGDVVLLALGGSTVPGIQVLDFDYLLLLNPNDVYVTTAFFVTDPEGLTRIPLPPYPSGFLYTQSLVITADPSYTPGSWTNAVAL